MKSISIILVSLLLVLGNYALAVDDYSQMSLDDLLNVQLSVASGSKAVGAREAPGIVSFINDDEIKKSGARDLVDVLMMVPGFNFSIDFLNFFSTTFRGNNAAEGKVLLLIDGFDLTDVGYQNVAWFNRFDISNIKKIEIIRGPGSALYGGTAEFAVINVITKSAEDYNGLSFSSTLGQHDFKFNDNYLRKNISLGFGKKFENDLKFTASVFSGVSRWSYRDFYDVYGNKYELGKRSFANPMNLNVSAEFKNLELRYMIDNYQTASLGDAAFGYGPANQYPNTVTGSPSFAREEPIPTDFNNSFFQAKYTFDKINKLKIIPKFSYKTQYPFATFDNKFLSVDGGFGDIGITAEKYSRMLGNITNVYDFNDKTNIQFGAEYTYDKKHFIPETNTTLSKEDFEKKVKTTSGFAQFMWNTDIVNLTAGARYDSSSYFDNKKTSAFVPRIGLTKVIGPWHGKLLYSQAYRTPSFASYEAKDLEQKIHEVDSNGVQSVSYAPTQGKPEHTRVIEFESGYQFNQNFFASINAYDILMKDPIFYSMTTEINYDGTPTFIWPYANSKNTAGTSGIELVLKESDKIGSTSFTTSFYRAHKEKMSYSRISLQKRPWGEIDTRGDDVNTQLLNMPPWKLTLSRNFEIIENLNLNMSMIYNSPFYAYDIDSEIFSEYESAGNTTAYRTKVHKHKSTLLTNLYINYKNAFSAKNLSLGFGVYNLFASDYKVQPGYDAGVVGKPVFDREYLLRLTYEM